MNWLRRCSISGIFGDLEIPLLLISLNDILLIPWNWSLHHVSFWFKVTRRGCYHAFLAWVLIITSTKTWNGWPCHGCLASGSKKAFHDFTIKSAGLSGGHSFNQSLEQLTLPSSLLSMNFSMFCFDHNFNQNLAWVTFGNLDRMKTGNMGIQSRLKKHVCQIFTGLYACFCFSNLWAMYGSIFVRHPCEENS